MVGEWAGVFAYPDGYTTLVVVLRLHANRQFMRTECWLSENGSFEQGSQSQGSWRMRDGQLQFAPLASDEFNTAMEVSELQRDSFVVIAGADRCVFHPYDGRYDELIGILEPEPSWWQRLLPR